MNKLEHTPQRRCAIYARTATTEQTPGSAAKDQVLDCRHCAEKHGWTVVNDHVYVDIGVSGLSATEHRPALARLIEDTGLDRREFDVVLVSSTDRLGRSMENMIRLLKALSIRGVQVVPVDRFNCDVLKMVTLTDPEYLPKVLKVAPPAN